MSSVLPPNSKPQHLAVTQDKPVTDRPRVSGGDPGAATAQSGVVAGPGPELKLSASMASVLREAGFDQQKVDSLKSAVASGNYPLDLDRIADSFMDLERML